MTGMAVLSIASCTQAGVQNRRPRLLHHALAMRQSAPAMYAVAADVPPNLRYGLSLIVDVYFQLHGKVPEPSARISGFMRTTTDFATYGKR